MICFSGLKWSRISAPVKAFLSFQNMSSETRIPSQPCEASVLSKCDAGAVICAYVWWMCSRSIWTQGSPACRELILKSANIHLWIGSLIQWWFHPNCWVIERCPLPKHLIGTFLVCNICWISVSVAGLFRLGLCNSSHWSTRWIYREGSKLRSGQSRAVDNCRCKPETYPVYLSLWIE